MKMKKENGLSEGGRKKAEGCAGPACEGCVLISCQACTIPDMTLYGKSGEERNSKVKMLSHGGRASESRVHRAGREGWREENIFVLKGPVPSRTWPQGT